MGTLLIDKEARKRIDKVKSFSRKNPMRIDELKSVLIGNVPPAGDRKEHVLLIDFGFRVVYSIEEQPDANVYHHLSVSIDNPGKFPNKGLLIMLMEAFDIGKCLDSCKSVWIEGDSVNILKLWDPYKLKGGG